MLMRNERLSECRLCPRNCGVDRYNTTGYCGCGADMMIVGAALHRWEEPCLCGENGAGTVFFAGCNLGCVYCQNSDISTNLERPRAYTPRMLADLFKRLEDMGAANIDLVTPTQWTEGIIETLSLYRPSVPVVYNCGGYESFETLKRLEGLVDIYLTDMKYYDSFVSGRYSNAEDYFLYASAALLEMKRQQPTDEFYPDGRMKKGVIVRHLVLPTLSDQSKKIALWLKENISPDTCVSIMNQYVPFGRAVDFPEINKRIRPIEGKSAVRYFAEAGFTNGFTQEISSASEEYIPPFERMSKTDDILIL